MPAAADVRQALRRSEKITSLHEAQAIELTDADRTALEGDIAHVTELVAGIA